MSLHGSWYMSLLRFTVHRLHHPNPSGNLRSHVATPGRLLATRPGKYSTLACQCPVPRVTRFPRVCAKSPCQFVDGAMLCVGGLYPTWPSPSSSWTSPPRRRGRTKERHKTDGRVSVHLRPCDTAPTSALECGSRGTASSWPRRCRTRSGDHTAPRCVSSGDTCTQCMWSRHQWWIQALRHGR